MFKFALDQKVYFMKNNKINCAAVSRREYKDFTPRENAGINSSYLGKVCINYFLSNGEEISENNIYASETNVMNMLTDTIVIDKAAQ